MKAMTPRARAFLEWAVGVLGSVGPQRFPEPIDPSAFGLPEGLARLRRDQDWQEEDVWSTPAFRASLFLMPAGRTMPIHDHPGMDVLLKVLWGQVRIRSYDWAEGRPGHARATSDRIVSPADDPQRLGPRSHNLHRLDALEDSAFLDVCAPDYSEEDGRPCRYYVEEEVVGLEGDTLVRLRSTPAPQ